MSSQDSVQGSILPVPDRPLVTEDIYDVRPEQYPAVIRDMIRHEDDVTNHRIMWLLVGQGFLANAFVTMKTATYKGDILSLGGILIALSAFVMLYRSYQARGYLRFLGRQAKQGMLQEVHLPLTGWPAKRIKGWWRDVWVCPWIGRFSDLEEPWVLLPFLFMVMWLGVLLLQWAGMHPAIGLILATILAAVILSLLCTAWVWSQRKDEELSEERRRT